MKLRSARVDDLDAVCALDPLTRGDAARRKRIRAAFEEGFGWVAEADGVLLGFALAGPWFYGHPFLELLVVRESARRHGVGRALVRAVEARFAGAKLFTSTNQSNAPMQRLLASLGYTPSGVIHNLDPGDPELVFVRLG